MLQFSFFFCFTFEIIFKKKKKKKKKKNSLAWNSFMILFLTLQKNINFFRWVQNYKTVFVKSKFCKCEITVGYLRIVSFKRN